MVIYPREFSLLLLYHLQFLLIKQGHVVLLSIYSYF